MEPIISKLQEGVKYPRFERDATTIINDLVEHITKERGVYSSSIEPNPNEHKVWFNTNNNTLNIYENGRWNTISGQGGGSGSSSGAIIDSATINTSTINGGYLTGNITASGATIDGGNIHGATLGAINVTSGSINYAYINNAHISGGTLTGTINANAATISGGTISGATISGGYINNAYINASGAYMQSINISNGNIGGSILLTGTINGGTINGATISGGTLTGTIDATNATISGGSINVKSVKADSVETPYIKLTSGSKYNSIQLLGDDYVFNGKLADSTLFHSIALNNGSIAGLTSIKTLSYTGLTIEPYDVTGTGTPIIINGRAAGINIIADSTAHLNIEGITKLNWIKGSSNGYMMTFNTTNNTINSNYDTFNITNGTISGSANINLTLSGTISGGTISGATISGGNINGATLGGINITSGSISFTNINSAYISGGNLVGTINAGGATINAGSKILATCTGSNPMLIPNGGNIGDNSASLTLCGITLTGGDFTKLKNLQ